MNSILRRTSAALAVATLAIASPALAGSHGEKSDAQATGKMSDEKMSDEQERAQMAAEVLSAAVTSEDGAIPEALLRKAWGVAVVPHVVKGAFGVGGRWGKGLVTCRTKDGRWSAPSFVSMGGASYGFQIGVEATDLILVFTDRSGLEGLLEDKVKLGADAGLTAGPIGRKAEAGTNLTLDSAIYSYSRSKGLFAGVALDGAVMTVDEEANGKAYGKDVSADALLHGKADSNATVQPFLKAMQQHVPRREA
ncbi:MAG TPA: lipid-binding SYLF domain-containing protein [bacterium]|nr:lipid-binding SYLF domain-containing protein [bacterium]